jgi:hypothetical protein
VVKKGRKNIDGDNLKEKERRKEEERKQKNRISSGKEQKRK